MFTPFYVIQAIILKSFINWFVDIWYMSEEFYLRLKSININDKNCFYFLKKIHQIAVLKWTTNLTFEFGCYTIDNKMSVTSCGLFK